MAEPHGGLRDVAVLAASRLGGCCSRRQDGDTSSLLYTRFSHSIFEKPNSLVDLREQQSL